jgi:hypothetical protein
LRIGDFWAAAYLATVPQVAASRSATFEDFDIIGVIVRVWGELHVIVLGQHTMSVCWGEQS